MGRNLERYDKLVTAILFIVIFVLGIGWWFAEEKSEPVYLSKIDKLMFDKDNKAPKFVLTLPDKLVVKSKTTEEFVDIISAPPPPPPPQTQQKEEPFSLEALLSNIPNILMLPSVSPTIQNKYIESAEGLFENTEDGKILPKISAEGLKPWMEYGNVVKTQPNFKKVAIVIGNLGFDIAAVSKIAESFDSAVSMSFTPYMTKSFDAITAARKSGHETYMDMPLASKDFLKEDTGPLSINLNLTNEILQDRFYQILNRSAPFGGLIVRDGALYDVNSTLLTGLLSEAKSRGLLVVDAVSGKGLDQIKIDGLARRKADIVIDKDMSKETIHEQLKKAETIAFDKGQVLIVTDAKPLIVVALHEWIQTFSPQVSYEEAKNIDITKPFAVVPVSNLVVE